MKQNCEGCKCEFESALEYQEEKGLYFATTKEKTGFEEGKCFMILMVSDRGKIIIS